jgi:hypothetical protein
VDTEALALFAVGDAAAVTDVTRHGQLAAQTAQHAQRQGLTAARNVLASLGHGKARAYKHRDLGFAVDLTGRNAIATPLGVRLSGAPAKPAGRAYHLRALSSGRLRVLSDWVNAALGGRQIVEIGLVDQPTQRSNPKPPAAAKSGPCGPLIRVMAAGVGNWDEFARLGDWDIGRTPPMALGVEAAGVITAVGARINRWG